MPNNKIKRLSFQNHFKKSTGSFFMKQPIQNLIHIKNKIHIKILSKLISCSAIIQYIAKLLVKHLSVTCKH